MKFCLRDGRTCLADVVSSACASGSYTCAPTLNDRNSPMISGNLPAGDEILKDGLHRVRIEDAMGQSAGRSRSSAQSPSGRRNGIEDRVPFFSVETRQSAGFE
jgi:hypothetical protein